MERFNGVDLVALILLVIGGLNWGLIGLLEFNLVDAIFGAGSLLARIVYILVGISALYTLMVIYKISNKLQAEQ